MGSAICGGLIPWYQWIKQKSDEMNLMCFVRKRETVVDYRRKKNHYRFKIIDPLGDCWYWEDERKG